MKKLGEKQAVVRCRHVDVALVKDVMEPARKQYTAVLKAEAPALSLDQDRFLPPPPTSTTDGDVASWCALCLATMFISLCARPTAPPPREDYFRNWFRWVRGDNPHSFPPKLPSCLSNDRDTIPCTAFCLNL